MFRRLMISQSFFCIIGLAGIARAQVPAPESPRLTELSRMVTGGDTAAPSRFWAEIALRHSPLIERISGDSAHVLATFLWRGDGTTNDVVLMAQPDGVVPFRDPRSHLLKLPGTDVWYRTHRLPADEEFSYVFSANPPTDVAGNVGATLRADPFNPFQYRILNGPERSIARMPAVPPNPWSEGTSAPTKVVHEHILSSAILRTGSQRKVWVYTTSGSLEHANLLVLLDGSTYLNSVPTARIVDNLFAAHRIGPTVVVFIPDGPGDAWQKDLYFSEDFVSFVGGEVLPWVQREYHFAATPRRTAIGGESIAGLTAAFVAFRRPELFTKVLAQSGSFWLNNHDADRGEPEWLARQFLAAPRRDVSFWIDVGRMEFVANEADRFFTPFVPGTTSLLAANRHLRDILRSRCYAVAYSETDGGHEPLRWARTLPDGLTTIFGAQQPRRRC